MLNRWLAHPLTHGLDIDDPATTHLRRQIVQSKPFLRRIYQEWYTTLLESLPTGQDLVLELGSGGGFLREYIPGLITSEIFFCPDLSAVLDGLELPFLGGALQAIVFTNVLHHLPRPRRFFAEAGRCIRPGGVISMIEPWASAWSRLIYRRLHSEPFAPDVSAWEFPSSGPLSGANGALPWVMLERDRAQFEREFPQWQIERVRPFMPFRYLVSGGVSLRSLMPAWSYGAWQRLELAFAPRMAHWAMFAHIVLRRTG